MNRSVLGLVVASLFPVVAAAVDTVATTTEAKRLHIVRLDTAPVIDGVLDEAMWQEATPVGVMHQVEPLEFATASERTEIRVFVTRDALYVGARMFQDPAQITANIQKQGADAAVYEDDWFGFDVDPWNARRNGYFFIVNPNGVRWDGAFKNISGFDHDWSGFWQAEAHRDPHGWTAEFELPFNAVSFDPGSGTWGVNFERRIARTGEYIAWSTRGQQVNPSTNGTATGFDDLHQGLGLGVVPSVVARSEDGSHQGVEPSLDVYYRLTPELTATVTANTDFSATDVDTRRVNLTRFSLFFPEKRDFFLRDADIFEFGHLESNGRPFFSRRIGLNRFGRPVDIDYGAKISGHVGAFDLGSLYIRQGDDPETGVAARDIVVARAAAHVLDESSVGVLLTHGDPRSELDNTVVGADFSLRNSTLRGGRAVQMDGWYQRSDSGGSADDAAGIALSTSTPVGWYGKSAWKRIGAGFDPALGFVNRPGIQDWTSDGGYTWRFAQDRALSLVELGAEHYLARSLDLDRMESSLVGAHVRARNNRGDEITLAAFDSRERLGEPFTIFASRDGSKSVTIPAASYSFAESELKLSSNRARRVSVDFALRAGDYYDGSHRAAELALAWKPSRHFNVAASMAQDRIDLPGGEFTVQLYSLDATIAFDAHWSWTGVAQYDNVSEVLGFNGRLHWTPRAGRNAYLVVNLGRDRFDPGQDQREIVLKYNHDLRF